MRIALDAMGSDRAPAVEVEGAIGALLDRSDLHVVFVGDRDRVEAELTRHPDAPRDRIRIVHTTEVIEMGESPAQAVRRKQDSSIVVGTRLHKEGEVDAFVSAGSTGAVMAASLIILRPLAGVDRPAIGADLPSTSGRFLLLDMGANVDVKPQHLLQFAHLGHIYARDLMGIEKPRVGLLNIGEEEEKGNEQTVEAHRLLKLDPALDFVGNIEGRDIIRGKCDVLVCDGFVGNVLLKFYESMSGFMAGFLRSAIAEQGVQLDIARLFKTLDYTQWGGAPLLGVNGVTIICHGGSPPIAIHNALRAAASCVESGMVEHIAGRLNRQAEASPAHD
jgi:glycerol-3-phosphate acyltransferase PlsX